MENVRTGYNKQEMSLNHLNSWLELLNCTMTSNVEMEGGVYNMT